MCIIYLFINKSNGKKTKKCNYLLRNTLCTTELEGFLWLIN